MSFHPFFSDGAPDLPGSHPQDDFHPYAPRPTRPASSHPSTIDALLHDPTSQQQPQQPTPQAYAQRWGYPPQDQLSLFQEDTGQQYYQLLNNASSNAATFPDATSQGASSYLPSPPKIDLPAQYRNASYASSSRYPPSNPSYPTPTHPFLEPSGLAYPSEYHEQGLELTGHHPGVDVVKEEPHTPAGSPQFIFEFPGGEDVPSEPPPFELAPAVSFLGDRAPSTTLSLVSQSVDPRCESTPPPPFGEPGERGRSRPGSPTTEAMRSMMSTFRVDPFASYDVDAGSKRKRKKKGSTYALVTDPEASSREEPLMLTFQLDVPGMEGDVEDGGSRGASWGFELDVGASTGDGGGGGGGSDLYPALDTIPMELENDVDDYDTVYAAGAAKESYRLGHASFDDSGDSPEADLTSYATGSVSASSVYASATILPYPSTSSRHSTPESQDDPEELEYPLNPDPTSITVPLPPAPPSSASLSPVSNNLIPLAHGPRYRPPTKMHICWICQKEFPRPSGLATHMNIHSGLKPYKCPVPTCSKTFAVRSNARRHLRVHGTILDDPGAHVVSAPEPLAHELVAAATAAGMDPPSATSTHGYVYSMSESSPSAESSSSVMTEEHGHEGEGPGGVVSATGFEFADAAGEMVGKTMAEEGVYGQYAPDKPLPDASRTVHTIALGIHVAPFGTY